MEVQYSYVHKKKTKKNTHSHTNTSANSRRTVGGRWREREKPDIQQLLETKSFFTKLKIVVVQFSTFG